MPAIRKKLSPKCKNSRCYSHCQRNSWRSVTFLVSGLLWSNFFAAMLISIGLTISFSILRKESDEKYKADHTGILCKKFRQRVRKK